MIPQTPYFYLLALLQVHRDVKPENVMIFDADFRKVKLIDFGMTRKCGSYVRRLIGSIPYSPPEVCDAVQNDILVSTAMDIWAFGVLLFCSLTGKAAQRQPSVLAFNQRNAYI